MYLSNLEKLQGNRAVEQVGNYIKILERLHQTSNRPVSDFLQLIGLENIGIEQVLLIIQSADIPKQKRYNAKQYILKQADKICLPEQSDRVNEILSYFSLAS